MFFMLFWLNDQINVNRDKNLTDENKGKGIIKEFKSID